MSNLVFQSFTARKKKVVAPLYTWSDTTTWNPQPIPFTGTPGPCLEAAEIQSDVPADYVRLFLTDELLGMICHNSNRHAARTIAASQPLPRYSRLRAWKEVEVAQLKKFIGLLLLTGKFLSLVE